MQGIINIKCNYHSDFGGLALMKQSIIAVLIIFFTSNLSAFAGTWSDGFEHPELDDWEVHFLSGNQPVWEIEHGLLLANQSGASGVWIGDDTWEDYSVKVTVILLEDRACGPATPNSHGAVIFTSGRRAPFQNHYYGVGIRLFDGKGPGVFAGVHDGWRAPIVLEHVARKVRFGSEYQLRMTEEGKLIKCYLDGGLVLQFKQRYTTGIVGLYIFNMRAYFDDFVVTGANIPDGGPGLGKAVKPKAGCATTGASIKQQ